MRVRLPRELAATVLRVLGPSAAQELEQRFSRMCGTYAWPANTKLQRHLREGILPGFAFYRMLRDKGLAQAAALESIDKIFEECYARNRARMARLSWLSFIYPVLRLYIRKAMAAYPPEGWETVWLENSRDRIRFDMRSCYYLDRLSELGAPELTPSFCS
jgi:hypothetical protein